MAAFNEPFGSYFDDTESMTPSALCDNNENSNGSYYETGDADNKSDTVGSDINVQWTGYGRRIPVILFTTEAFHNERRHFKVIGEWYHLAFKFATTDCKIIRTILLSHGFNQVKPNSQEYNLIWCNSHPKLGTFRFMSSFQKINHFPRSYELTRKDRLFKNIQRMQQMKGHRHFDFIPASFVLPGDYEEFCSSFTKNKGLYIVKPVASSQGKGVFIITHPDEVPLDENLIVSKYISSPLVIDGFKFDIRVYVAVTSYDPLVIYLYEEGLTRFATVKYEKDIKHIKNKYMHLTNFSVNKRSQDYVKNDDPNIEDYGNKWSMGALLRYLRTKGNDTAALMMQIESVIIKTILSAESSIATACKLYQPFRGNCFELYGFDILIDQTLKPWVLEVNFSPSLACDTPLDLKIKSNMLCDLFSLVGVVCQDPALRSRTKCARSTKEIPNRITSKLTSSSHLAVTSEEQLRIIPVTGLNSEEIKILRQVKEEESRTGGWVRIFPNADSWNKYGSLVQFPGSHNLMLHQRLFPDAHSEATGNKMCGTLPARPSSSKHTEATGNKISGTLPARPLSSKCTEATGNRINKTTTARPLSSTSKNKIQLVADENGKASLEKQVESHARALARVRQYERKLGALRSPPEQTMTTQMISKKGKLIQGLPEVEDIEDSESGEDIMNEKGEDIKIQEIKLQGAHSGMDNKKLTSFTKLHRKLENFSADDLMNETESRNLHEKMETAALGEPHQFGVENAHDKMDSRDLREKHQLFCSGFDVKGFLQSGFILSEVQARTTFVTYLKRVQERLLSNWRTFHHQRGVKAVNAQMVLIKQFLKCASEYMPPTVSIVVPSKKLPLEDMKRILAKQLDIFINLYCKETEQIKHMYVSEEVELKNSEPYDGQNELLFDNFVTTATEDELEAIMMIYTKNIKSQTFFLRMSSRLGSDTLTQDKRKLLPGCHGNPTFRYNPMVVHRRDDVTGVRQAFNLHGKKASRVAAHLSGNKHCHGLTRCHHSSPNSCSKAAAIYSQKLRRPWSASRSSTAHKGNLGMMLTDDQKLDTKHFSDSAMNLRDQPSASEMTSSKPLQTLQKTGAASNSYLEGLISRLRNDIANKKFTEVHCPTRYMTLK